MPYRWFEGEDGGWFDAYGVPIPAEPASGSVEEAVVEGQTKVASSMAALAGAYQREMNLTLFTRVLLESGYRPYQFLGNDGVRRMVWAKHQSRVVEWIKKSPVFGMREDIPLIDRDLPDLSLLGGGVVEDAVWMNGELVRPNDTILLDPADGGGIRFVGF